MKHMGNVFQQSHEVLNFCEHVNTQPVIEVTISRIENTIEALSQILAIIPCEDRVVTEFLRNILTL